MMVEGEDVTQSCELDCLHVFNTATFTVVVL